jgi:hypothetical protein
MKIIIIQSAGMHDGKRTKYCKNDYMRECLSLKYAFEENNWEADVWGLRHSNFNNPPDFNSYDYLLNLENYEMNWLPDFSKITNPIKMQWIIDLHCQNSKVYGKITNNMDIILHSTKSLMEDYRKLHPNKKHIWFPNGFDNRYFKNREMERNKNIIFIGNICNRGELLQKMFKGLNMEVYIMKTGEEMLNLLNETKIQFNKSISVDVNYRNFETIGCGTCLLTNHLQELEELGFQNGVNCLMYKNINEIPNILNYALRNNNWLKISKEGELFSKKHTYIIRVNDLIKQIINL